MPLASICNTRFFRVPVVQVLKVVLTEPSMLILFSCCQETANFGESERIGRFRAFHCTFMEFNLPHCGPSRVYIDVRWASFYHCQDDFALEFLQDVEGEMLSFTDDYPAENFQAWICTCHAKYTSCQLSLVPFR